MGWVLKGIRQKLVVCRYEEEPARGVSLLQMLSAAQLRERLG